MAGSESSWANFLSFWRQQSPQSNFSFMEYQEMALGSGPRANIYHYSEWRIQGLSLASWPCKEVWEWRAPWSLPRKGPSLPHWFLFWCKSQVAEWEGRWTSLSSLPMASWSPSSLTCFFIVACLGLKSSCPVCPKSPSSVARTLLLVSSFLLHMLFSAAWTFASKCHVPKVEGQNSFCIVKWRSHQRWWCKSGLFSASAISTHTGTSRAPVRGCSFGGRKEAPCPSSDQQVLQACTRTKHHDRAGTAQTLMESDLSRPPSMVTQENLKNRG